MNDDHISVEKWSKGARRTPLIRSHGDSARPSLDTHSDVGPWSQVADYIQPESKRERYSQPHLLNTRPYIF